MAKIFESWMTCLTAIFGLIALGALLGTFFRFVRMIIYCDCPYWFERTNLLIYRYKLSIFP